MKGKINIREGILYADEYPVGENTYELYDGMEVEYQIVEYGDNIPVAIVDFIYAKTSDSKSKNEKISHIKDIIDEEYKKYGDCKIIDYSTIAAIKIYRFFNE